MDSEPVVSTGPRAGDGARIAGRAVIIGGIAMGLMFGLVWWVLVGWRGDRAPVAEVALPQGGPSARFLPFASPSSSSSSSSSSSPSSFPSPAEATVPAPPLPSGPGPTVPVPPPTITTGRPPGVLAAHYVTTTAWDTGYVAQITITSLVAGPQNYEIRLQLPAGVTVNDAWSSSASSSSTGTSGTVVLRGGPVSAQHSVAVGFQAAKPRALADPRQFEPVTCTINGNLCG